MICRCTPSGCVNHVSKRNPSESSTVEIEQMRIQWVGAFDAEFLGANKCLERRNKIHKGGVVLVPRIHEGVGIRVCRSDTKGHTFASDAHAEGGGGIRRRGLRSVLCFFLERAIRESRWAGKPAS